MNGKKDVFKKAEGDKPTTVTNPTNGTTVSEKKFSITNTTDKMGITTAGAVTKGVWWTLVITSFIWLGIGLYMKKISLTYVK